MNLIEADNPSEAGTFLAFDVEYDRCDRVQLKARGVEINCFYSVDRKTLLNLFDALAQLS
ncbi:MAG: hypothetical protein V3T17_17745 [Pseudomonadales bacterium]